MRKNARKQNRITKPRHKGLRRHSFACGRAYKTHHFTLTCLAFLCCSSTAPLETLTSVIRAGQSWQVSWGLVAQNGFTEGLFVCDSCSIVLKFAFPSCWPSGEQALRLCNFWSTILTTVLVTFWDQGKPIFMQPDIQDPSLHTGMPDFSEISDFCHPRGQSWPASWSLCDNFWSTVLTRVLLTFWDPGKSYL